MFESSEEQVATEKLDLVAMWRVEDFHRSNPEIFFLQNCVDAPLALLEEVSEG